jgi:hypothetical protein
MTATSTAELEGILAARKAELKAQQNLEQLRDELGIEPPIQADVVTGEIVSASDREVAPSVIPAPTPDPVVHYPEVPPKVVGGLPYVREYVKLARTIQSTEMVPKVLQGRYDAITACFMRGYELGLGPMQALDSFNVIEGKVGLTAEAMRALIMQAGHFFKLEEGDGYAEVRARRSDWPADEPTAVYRYDMGDAETAQLLRVPSSGRKGGWQKNPRAMLAARATSGAARAWFADVLAGMSYTPEEIRDFTDEGEAPTFPSTQPQTTAALDSSTPRKDGSPPRSTTPPTLSGQTDPKAEPSSESGEPPTLTSLNLQTPEPAELEEALAPGEGAVLVQTRQALTALIAGLPTVQQPLCRTFIRQHFPQGPSELNSEQLQKCIDIAAGWPDSVEQHPLPEELEEEDDSF